MKHIKLVLELGDAGNILTAAFISDRMRMHDALESTVPNDTPEIGKEAEEEGPKLDQAEEQKNKKLGRHEARKVSGEDSRLPAITQRVQEKEIKKKDAKAGRTLKKEKHAKASNELSREERSMDVVMARPGKHKRATVPNDIPEIHRTQVKGDTATPRNLW